MWQPDLYPLLLTYLQPCERAAHDNIHTEASYQNAVEIGHLEYAKKYHNIGQNYDLLMTYAIQHNQLEVVKLFIDVFAVTPDFKAIAQYGRVEIIKYFITCGHVTSDSELYTAVEHNQLLMIPIIIDANASKSPNSYVRQIMILESIKVAINRNHLDAILILSKYPPINYDSLLPLATYYNNLPAMRLLIKLGAKNFKGVLLYAKTPESKALLISSQCELASRET